MSLYRNPAFFREVERPECVRRLQASAGTAAGTPAGAPGKNTTANTAGNTARDAWFAKATTVVFWKFANDAVDSQDGEEHEQVTRSRLLFTRGYSVFNCAQVDGYTPKADAETPIEHRIESAEQLFSRIHARVIHQGNRAFYSAADDVITMPLFAAFFTPVDYYGTRAHETGHWTSRDGRCNRELGKRFGDNAYCMEELIAELTAAFVCAHLGLSAEPRPDHAQYIASWLKVLKADRRAIFTAASKAQRAADFIIQCSESEIAGPHNQLKAAA